jgi:hypothetical protein
MKTYEKLSWFIELNDDGPQSCLNTTFTQDCKGNNHMALWSINMENEAYIIKYINQWSLLNTKYVYAKRQTRRWQNECTQINKYEHEHDGGSKKN